MTTTKLRGRIHHGFKPSYVEGAARAFDIFGHMPVRRCGDSSPEAVWFAIQSDWEAVGRDLHRAMIVFGTKHGLEEKLGVPGDRKTTASGS